MIGKGGSHFPSRGPDRAHRAAERERTMRVVLSILFRPWCHYYYVHSPSVNRGGYIVVSWKLSLHMRMETKIVQNSS